MADREKVIKGLECCLSGPMQCEKCPYKTDADTSIPHCVRDLRENAIELLKAQEPKFVSDIAEAIIGCKPKVKVGHCPSCGVLMSETDRFCRKCGQAVKWDD